MHRVRQASLETDPRFTLSLALWLCVQLLSLTLSALQIRLSYHWPDPPQMWAVEQMLVAQYVFLPLILFNSRQNASFSISVFACGSVMLMFTQVISAHDNFPTGAICTLMMWTLTIHLVHSTSIACIARPILHLWTTGGVLLEYLAAEFGEPDGITIISPLSAAIVISHEPLNPAPWTIIAIALTLVVLSNLLLPKKLL